LTLNRCIFRNHVQITRQEKNTTNLIALKLFIKFWMG